VAKNPSKHTEKATPVPEQDHLQSTLVEGKIAQCSSKESTLRERGRRIKSTPTIHLNHHPSSQPFVFPKFISLFST
jgi:hypothetical protein